MSFFSCQNDDLTNNLNRNTSVSIKDSELFLQYLSYNKQLSNDMFGQLDSNYIYYDQAQLVVNNFQPTFLVPYGATTNKTICGLVKFPIAYESNMDGIFELSKSLISYELINEKNIEQLSVNERFPYSCIFENLKSENQKVSNEFTKYYSLVDTPRIFSVH